MARGKVIAGIDVGTDKVCTIITTTSEESDKLHVIGVSAHPSSGIKKSQIVDLEDTINAITESVEAAERMAGLTISNAYISISGAHVGSQNSKGVVAVAQPEGEITNADIDRVIEAARALSLPSSEEILHVIPREFQVDSQAGIKDPLGMTGVRLESEVHVITAATTAMKNIIKCIGEIGVNVSSLVFSGLASAHSTLSETEKELGVVLIDIGAGSTSVSIYVEGALSHSAVIPIGARNITNDLAIGMRISLTSAEKIKLLLSEEAKKPEVKGSTKEIIQKRKEMDKLDLGKLGIKEELKTASRKTLVDGIIKPRLVEIFTLIGKEIKESGFAGLTPAGVVVTGGGSNTVGIVETAKRVLSMPARVGSPRGLKGLVEEIQSPAFATATGLILYGDTQTESTPSKFSLPKISGSLSKLPIKGASEKIVKLLKSLLP
ncbi:cell division protein FtsA [Patescibacteria group bacterium]